MTRYRRLPRPLTPRERRSLGDTFAALIFGALVVAWWPAALIFAVIALAMILRRHFR